MVKKLKLLDVILISLDDSKAQDVVCIDLPGYLALADSIVICHGTSSRHVKSVANNLIEAAKNADFSPIGVEGLDESEWILIDLGDVIVHVMQSRVRDFYQLEKLWEDVG